VNHDVLHRPTGGRAGQPPLILIEGLADRENLSRRKVHPDHSRLAHPAGNRSRVLAEAPVAR
jgi:hypothetical protein